MPRIRTIKPEFWTDSKTGTLSDFEKCLFLGMLNHCDDYGVIVWNDKEFAVKIFPYHSGSTTGAVNAAVLAFLEKGLLVFFSHSPTDDAPFKKYLHIVNFDRHQVINKLSHPLIHGWKKGDTIDTYAKRTGDGLITVGGDATTPLPDHYGSDTGELPSGKERKGKEGSKGTLKIVSISKEKEEGVDP